MRKKILRLDLNKIAPLPSLHQIFDFLSFISSGEKRTSSLCLRENKGFELHVFMRRTKVSRNQYKRWRGKKNFHAFDTSAYDIDWFKMNKSRSTVPVHSNNSARGPGSYEATTKVYTNWGNGKFCKGRATKLLKKSIQTESKRQWWLDINN